MFCQKHVTTNPRLQYRRTGRRLAHPDNESKCLSDVEIFFSFVFFAVRGEFLSYLFFFSFVDSKKFTSWRGASGVERGGLTGRSCDRTRCSGTAWCLCVCGNVAWVRRSARIATCSPPRCNGTASPLCGCGGGLWGASSWCRPFCSPRSRTCVSSAVAPPGSPGPSAPGRSRRWDRCSGWWTRGRTRTRSPRRCRCGSLET